MSKVEDIHYFFALLSDIYKEDIEIMPESISFCLYFNDRDNIDFETESWLVTDIGNGKKLLENVTQQMVDDRMRYLSNLN